MTLHEYYLYHANIRKVIKPVEEYETPTLFWCDMFHICNEHEIPVLDIWGPDMTNEEFSKYQAYFEFKPEFIGGDYVHHHYLKPPNKK